MTIDYKSVEALRYQIEALIMEGIDFNVEIVQSENHYEGIERYIVYVNE